MEREYIFWHTGRGCLVGGLTIGLGTVIALGLVLAWGRTMGTIALAALVLLPAVAFSFRVDARRLAKRQQSRGTPGREGR